MIEPGILVDGNVVCYSVVYSHDLITGRVFCSVLRAPSNGEPQSVVSGGLADTPEEARQKLLQVAEAKFSREIAERLRHCNAVAELCKDAAS